jgi:hypothetical protein
VQMQANVAFKEKIRLPFVIMKSPRRKLKQNYWKAERKSCYIKQLVTYKNQI